jgi:stearoyl-CoA desaturase (delta-9 desaturase)
MAASGLVNSIDDASMVNEQSGALQPSDIDHDNRWSKGLELRAVGWLGFVHLGVLAAPFFFTWKGLFLTFVLQWLTGCIGITFGFHRLLTHSSFRTYRPIRWMVAVLGTLAGEGPPLMWVAAHRKHHKFSDQDGDPHSPRDGGWWAHVLWMLPRKGSGYWTNLYMRYTPDLVKEPFMRFLNRTFLLWHIASGAALFTAGWLGWDMYTGISFLVYGMFVRLIVVLHMTWLINSATHIWGYRTYETTDDSRNLWWVGYLSYGEGWHNNHHAFPTQAAHGHKWWELDITYLTIAMLEKVGLAWDVVRIHPADSVQSKSNEPVAESSDDDTAAGDQRSAA